MRRVGGQLVTVGFLDLEGSTELLVQLGDVEGAAAVDAVLNVARGRLEPYGGREVKSLGDGLMLVFPAPRQAVVYAVAVQRALLGHRPAARIGINTGEISGSADDPVGEAVSAAARIAAKAAPREVLVSDVVRQLVGTIPGVRFADRGRTRLKGFPDRWRLHAASGSEVADEPVPTFGRDHELRSIERLLDGVAGGSGGVLVLEGEAGIGKTHLADVAAGSAAARGMRVVRGGADELAQDRPGLIVLALADALGVSLQSLMDDADLVGGTRGYAVIEAVGSAIEDLSTTVPVLVVVEDLQWADELSLQGLASLVRRIGPLPVAVVVTRRPTPRPALAERVVTGQPLEVEHLHLSGLDDAAVTAMVATLTGVPPGRNLSQRVAGASGNPLYVTELIRALDDNGEIGVRGGLAEVDDPALPASLRATVLGRLAALPERSVEMLRLASLLGRGFTLSDLATISGRRVVDVATDLRSIVDAAILTGESDTLSFRHDLIRDSVYDDILPAIRVDLHAAAGRALAAAGAPTVQVARQMELGARPGDLVAVEWLVRAGVESLSFDYAGAITMFQQALSVAGERWPGRAGVEAAQLEPLALCGRVDEARAIAHALLDRGVSARDEFVVQRALGVVAAASGDLASAVTETKAAAVLPGAPANEAIVLTCLEANLALLTGRAVEEVRAVGERTLAYAASCADASADVACVGHHTLALTDGVDGHYERATEHARASRRLLFDNGLPTRGYLIPDLWEATFLMLADRLDDALSAYRAASVRAERQGRMSLLVQTHAASGFVHLLAGRWDDAMSELEAGLVVTEETGNHAHDVGYHAMVALISRSRADESASIAALAAGHRALEHGRHLFGVDLLLWAEATATESDGDPAGALALLDLAWEQSAGLRGLVSYRNIGPPLVRLARLHGDHARCKAVADVMRTIAARTTAPSAIGAAQRAKGLADDDPELLVDAVSTYRASPRRIELAATCEDAGAALLRAGRDAEAAAVLDEAAAIHLECGAIADLARVEALLRSHGIRRRRRGPSVATHGWEALSPTERSVVDLVAQGMTNPRIGAHLYISRRTVETHVSHIFRKLGVTNRAQLAAAATSHAAGETR